MTAIVQLRIIFVLGILQGITAILILLSCRCFGGISLGAKLLKYPVFRKFYKYHCYLWWPFWISVVVHVVLAINLMGFPF
jgi:hypothetical protein